MDVLSIIPYAFFVVAIVYFHVAWAKRRLKQWADGRNYKILRCKLRLKNAGPFSYFTTSGSQYIFRIKVMDDKGNIRKGFARVGGYFFGLLRRQVEVKWDKKHSLESFINSQEG